MLHIVSHSDLLLRVRTPIFFHPLDSSQPPCFIVAQISFGDNADDWIIAKPKYQYQEEVAEVKFEVKVQNK